MGVCLRVRVLVCYLVRVFVIGVAGLCLCLRVFVFWVFVSVRFCVFFCDRVVSLLFSLSMSVVCLCLWFMYVFVCL